MKIERRRSAVPAHESAIVSGSMAMSEDKEKLATIAEIVELMEDTKKGKDWLLDQLKQKHQKINVKAGISTVRILKMCSAETLANILAYLRNDEFQDLEVIVPPITKHYHWFFTDIVAASDPAKTTIDQARKIILLNKLIESTDIFKQSDQDTTLVLPTGDGMAIGFDDSPEKPLLLAVEVHKGLNRYNKTRKKESQVQLRIGLDSGPVYIIKDLKGNENVWGPGIINARRIMDLADKMNILSSARFANDIKMLKPEYRQIMHPVGDYQIKHGDKVLVYNIYTAEVGNKRAPAQDKSQRSMAEEEVQKTSGRFLFNHISIDLVVQDIKSMETHHTMSWALVNISNEPVDRLFYYLDGDTSRDFPDLNVVVRDEEERELEIMSLNVNKPYHKEFFVKFGRPLKPGEKGRMATIEYDWDEPDRQYGYRFASGCKKFDFSVTVPRELSVQQKVVKVNTETGEKSFASTPATVKHHAGKTQIRWIGTGMRPYDKYSFYW